MLKSRVSAKCAEENGKASFHHEHHGYERPAHKSSGGRSSSGDGVVLGGQVFRMTAQNHSHPRFPERLDAAAPGFLTVRR